MIARRLARLALVAVLVAGCGGGDREEGSAQLWITRDRGREVLVVRAVPAGLTAMQAVHRVADVETRYGGRFVRSINGIDGSVTTRRDWFYYVNGYEADRGAAEYRLHPGDVLWWDFRSWREDMRVPVVVGAFPEPFLHGYGGKRRKTFVKAESPDLLRAARALARIVHGKAVHRVATRSGTNTIYVRRVPVRFSGSARTAGGPVTFVINGKDALRLARNPRLARFRYEGLR